MNKNNKMLISVSTEPVSSPEEMVVYLRELQALNVDYVHFDAMDGIFVPKVTYDHNYCAFINNNSIIPIDAHLMLAVPEEVVESYVKAGANIITVHYESFLNNRNDLEKCLKKIKSLGALAGLCIKPSTDINVIIDVLRFCDLVLVMGVDPGRSGQKFIEKTLFKVKILSGIRKQFKFNFIIEVDGGITPAISQQLKANGADMIVSGSFIHDSLNRKKAIFDLT
ncbi:MAG: ribulose-phosphate 3-epimerase [Clostridia bacterium]